MTTPPGSVGSCRHCLAWGVIAFSGMCPECVGWRVWDRWDRWECAGYDREVPLKHGHCRLCHQQALRQLGRMVIRETMPESPWSPGSCSSSSRPARVAPADGPASRPPSGPPR
ncbi:hypothetical protein ACFWBX_22540 [Streptomyces sp. NPDC059991]|uniref:hypothetical protein n=1 Tax=Streptomyces sp. NPDC059991 TaxID=3347028 RepID=UPI00368A1F50